MRQIQIDLLFAKADLSRANPWGIAVMLLAMLGVCFSGKIVGKIRAKDSEKAKLTIRLLGMIVLAGGAMLAILG